MRDKSLAYLSLLAGVMAGGYMGEIETNPYQDKGKSTPEDYVKPPTPIPNGMKEFTIDGITVHALNMKNAIKKVNKLKAVTEPIFTEEETESETKE